VNKRFKQTLTDLAIANTGTRNRIKLAAGVVFKNRLVAVGVNSYKSHPLMSKFGKNPEAIYLHAEVDAIKNALRVLSLQELEKSDILVVRVKRDEHDYKTCLAKPCEGCARAIETFNIRNLYYTE
jgi:tRNA(Arg) A34 adenosine deaminase TadA